MAIILFKKGTGEPVKVSEYGFEHSVESGNYFLTKDEAINYGKTTEAEVINVENIPESSSGLHSLADNGADTPQVSKASRPRKKK